MRRQRWRRRTRSEPMSDLPEAPPTIGPNSPKLLVGVATAACAACCAVPLFAIGAVVAGAVGALLLPAGAVLAATLAAVALLGVRRRRRVTTAPPCSCAPGASSPDAPLADDITPTR